MFNITTVLADSQPVFLKGLKSILNKIGNQTIEVKAQFRDGKQLMAYLLKSPPHLLILDFNLLSKDGLEVIKWMKKNKLMTKIMVLTAYDDSRLLKMVGNLKVDGYLLKTAEENVIKNMVCKILEGEGCIDIGNKIEHRRPEEKRPSRAVTFRDGYLRKISLTKREKQIVGLVADALSSKEIAQKLYISDQTVSVHRKNIMRKLGVSNTAALIKVAYAYGWR